MRAARELLKRLLRTFAHWNDFGRLGAWMLRTHREALRRRCDPFDTFTDSRGEDYELFSGLRELVIPLLRVRTSSSPPPPPPTPVQLDLQANACLLATQRALELLDWHGQTIAGRELVEIGGGSGFHACCLVASGARSITITTCSAYYEDQRPHDADLDEPLAAQEEELFRGRREAVERLTGNRIPEDAIRFLEDDVTSSELPSGFFDGVFSWQVLEHVSDPTAYFATVARILRPGGFALTQYNPFFSWTGGHPPCTLDMDWGHSRLGRDDLVRYLERFRPEEAEIALRFFDEHLNRLTLRDLLSILRASPLETLELLPLVEEEDLTRLSQRVLADVRALYPSAAALDLVSRFIWVLQRRRDR